MRGWIGLVGLVAACGVAQPTTGDTDDTEVVDTDDTEVVDTDDTEIEDTDDADDTDDTEIVDTDDTDDTDDTEIVDTDDTDDTDDTEIADTDDTDDTDDTEIVDTDDTDDTDDTVLLHSGLIDTDSDPETGAFQTQPTGLHTGPHTGATGLHTGIGHTGGRSWPTIPGCAHQGAPPRVANPTARTVTAATAGVPAMAQDLKGFAIALHQQMPTTEVNRVLSPLNIAGLVLSLGADAGGTTATQIDQTLAPGRPVADFRAAYGALAQDLHAPWGDRSAVFERGARVFHAAAYAPGSGWATASAPLGVGTEVVDFAADPAAARDLINDWVFDHTACLIPELLPQPVITPTTLSVVVDALGILAPWATPFSAGDTVPDLFTLEGGGRVYPDYMIGRNIQGGYGQVGPVDVLRLPSADPNITLTMAVPRGSLTLSQLETQLDVAMIDSILAAPLQGRWDVAVPLLDLRSAPDLGQLLADVGLTDLNTTTPNTGDLCTGCPLSALVHESVFLMDEEGIRAAAASAGIFTDSASATSNLIEIDQPFLFLLMDEASDTVLFMGRVGDPTR